MEQATLIPFVRKDLEVLFVGLNPANGSDQNGHYFSVRQDFWNQLSESGLITVRIDKSRADVQVFGTSKINFGNWSYGITDLVPNIAESQSKKVRATHEHCEALRALIVEFAPKAAILLHGDVLAFSRFLALRVPQAHNGQMRKLLDGRPTMFLTIGFPHGNVFPSVDKVIRYQEVRRYLLNA